MSPILGGTFTHLSSSTLISNLISIGLLAVPNYASTREVIGYAAVAGVTPLLFYISTWLSLPSKASLDSRLASHSRQESPYSNSFWLTSVTALSMIATVVRYSIVSFCISSIVNKHYEIMLTDGALKIILALALLELYTVSCIGTGLWKVNEAFREIQLKSHSINDERMPPKYNPLAGTHDSLVERI